MDTRNLCKAWLVFTVGVLTLLVSTMGAWGARVELGGVTLFRFVEPFKGLSPQQRASVVYRRIWDVLDASPVESRAELLDQITVDTIKGDVCIFLAEHLIVTIDDIHPRLNRSSPHELAGVWADNLHRGLSRYLIINAPLN